MRSSFFTPPSSALALVAFLCSAVLLAREAESSDWPQFHGPLRNNITDETGWLKDWPADGPPIVWKAQVGKGLSSFAVVNQLAYTAGNSGADEDTIYCLDLKTGREKWKFSYPCKSAPHEMPIVPAGPGATPTIAGGKLFMLSREGDLHCLDAENGKLLWKKNLVADLKGKRPVYGYASSILAECGYLFIDNGGDEQSTLCLDQKNGDIFWAKGRGEAGYATPAYVSSGTPAGMVVMFKGQALTVIDPMSGDILAEHAATTRDFANCATPFVHGTKVFISHTGSQGSSVLNFTDGKLTPAWTDKNLGLLFNSGVPWQGHLIAFNDQQRGTRDFRAVNLATGEPLWVNREIDKGTAIFSDDHLLILTNTGELVLAKPTKEALEIEARAQVLAGKSYVLPVLSHGYLLCKNNAGDVVCLDLSVK